MRTLSASVPTGARVMSSVFVATPRTPSDRNGSGTWWKWPPRRTIAPGSNGLQVERVEVELTPSFGVGGEQHLEATVELKPFDRIGAHATADPVRRLEHHHLVPAVGEHACARQAGQAGADDCDVGLLGQDRALAHRVSHVC